jgi:hypothetical protein
MANYDSNPYGKRHLHLVSHDFTNKIVFGSRRHVGLPKKRNRCGEEHASNEKISFA